MKIGIIGAGWIADKMAETLTGLDSSMKYAIAARDADRAAQFANQWGFEKSYGSYRELVEDPDVDLVYIATPHSHHFEHASLAINAGKPVLCEKAFTANAREADALLNLAHKKGVFITEAIWTRYMPLSLKVKELLDSGAIGTPRLLNASLCYMMEFKERILRPDLCGGALLDLGVYSINFCRMYFGDDVINETSNCIKGTTGMDMHNSISWSYRDGRIANIQSSALCCPGSSRRQSRRYGRRMEPFFCSTRQLSLGRPGRDRYTSTPGCRRSRSSRKTELMNSLPPSGCTLRSGKGRRATILANAALTAWAPRHHAKENSTHCVCASVRSSE